MDADGFDLAKSRVAIVGLGLMGGSLALALKGKCAEILGTGPRQPTLDAALAMGFVTKADTDPAAILPLADLIVLASPIPAILELIPRLGEIVPQPCVIIDLGSSKSDVMRAMSDLPKHLDPIGGHPICGKERLSLANAEAGLYIDAPFVLTPLPRTSNRARSLAEQLVAAVGARTIWLDAESHDRFIAATSHLPYLVASALALATPPEASVLVGPGFRSTSRLAGTPQSMMLGVLDTNRCNILSALSDFRAKLDDIIMALSMEDPSTLRLLLEQSAQKYGDLTQ